MSFCFKEGDILDSGCDYICHQVNCQGIMGAGLARQVKEKYPEVYKEYAHKCDIYNQTDLPGSLQIVETKDGKNICNLFAQFSYGNDGRRYTSYEAFWLCLEKIKKRIPTGSKIAFPYEIGCGLGGANWAVIRTMILEVLGDNFHVEIWKLK